MEATLTELQRNAGRVTDAIRRRETVQLTERGELFAEVQPHVKGMTGAEFRRVWQNRKRMDKATCDLVISAMNELDKAG